jgi:hypothetical protein
VEPSVRGSSGPSNRYTGHRFAASKERRSAEETTVDDVRNREYREPQEWSRYDERDAQRHCRDHNQETETGPARSPYLRVRDRRSVGIERRESFIPVHVSSSTSAKELSSRFLARDPDSHGPLFTVTVAGIGDKYGRSGPERQFVALRENKSLTLRSVALGSG